MEEAMDLSQDRLILILELESVESQLTFRRNISPLLATCFHAGFLLDLVFDPEFGGDMFLQNVG
jgi:hypothetical protein